MSEDDFDTKGAAGFRDDDPTERPDHAGDRDGAGVVAAVTDPTTPITDYDETDLHDRECAR
jgi:hypothetical protein